MKQLRIILSIALTFCLCSCKRHGDGRALIAVSVEPQRFLLEQIAGDDYKVVTLMKPGSNPETFEPTMNTRVDLDHADAYFYVGGLPFEHSLLESSGSLTAVNTSAGIEPLYGTHSHSHGHGSDCHGDHPGHDHHDEEADPHVWTSVKNARIMARNMTEALIRLKPEHEQLYRRRLAALTSRLDSLDSSISHRLESATDKTFMVWHPSLGYFARDYGLEQLSVGWESKEPSAAALRRAIDEAREHNVRVFFYQREFDTRQTQSLTSQLGLNTITIDPLGYDWIGQMNLIADELAK